MLLWVALILLSRVNAVPINYDVKLLEDSDITVWTAPPSKRYGEAELPPVTTGTSLFTSAARNEYEPFQVLFSIALPSPVMVTVELPEVQNVTVRQGRFSDGIFNSIRDLTCTNPQPNSTQCQASASTARHNIIWVTYFVPLSAQAGIYNGSVTLQLVTVKTINVTMQIYDFTLPETRNFINLNTVHPAEVSTTDSVEENKQELFNHRITPAKGTHPASFEYSDSWDTPPSPNNVLKCVGFNSEQSQDAGNTLDAQLTKYLKGDGWNCVGFQIEIGQRYVSDTEYRPTSFCSENIGSSQNGTASYNTAWGSFLTALGAYVRNNDLIGKVGYQIMKNPETAAEIGAAGELCKLSRDSAPDVLRIIEEEARADIVSSGCGYDIWITPVDKYDQGYSWRRQQLNQESIWLSPTTNNEFYPNPYNASSPGIETRIWGFLAWSSRARGMYWDNTVSNIFRTASGDINLSSELFREAWEDYEYLFIANGLNQPTPCTKTPSDIAAFAAAKSVTSFERSDSKIMNIRHALGQYNEDSITDIAANIEVETFLPLAVNFQDPSAPPATPVIVINGATWVKQGWSARVDSGIGWTGNGLLVPANLKATYNNVGDDRMSSALVDEGNNINSFWYPVPPGVYEVTVGCGDPRRLSTDTMNVVVNTVAIINNYSPTTLEPFQERTVTIEVTDGNGLEFKVGILGQSTYIMYIRINYADVIDYRCQSIVAVTDNSNVQPACKKDGCTALGFCPTPSPPTPIPPTPLPAGSTYGPTAVPPTPLPLGQTYAPDTRSPPTPLPLGETYGPTTVPTAVPTSTPPTPLPPGQTYGPTAVPTAVPTMVPPTPLPPGQTYGPTAVPTAVPTMVPPTPLPPGQTYGPTAVPTAVPTQSPPTPLPPGQTYGPTAVPTAVPTMVPPTPLPPGQTYGPTIVPTAVPTRSPPTPLPPGQTYGPTAVPTAVPTVVPPTPLPPGQTYGPTTAPISNVPSTPLPPGQTYGPTAVPDTMAPSDDEILPLWGWIAAGAGAAVLLLVCVGVLCYWSRAASGPPVAPQDFYSPEHIRYESMHTEQQKTAMNTGMFLFYIYLSQTVTKTITHTQTGLRRDVSGNGVYYI